MSLDSQLATVILTATLLTAGHTPVVGQQSLTGDLDPFISLPGAYALTPDDLEKRFEQGNWSRNPYFKWLTEDKTRAIFQRKDMDNLKVDLTLLKGTVPIEEAVIDFKDGTLMGVTISIYNRGDGGTITTDDFNKRFVAMGKHIGEQLAIRPTKREASTSW